MAMSPLFSIVDWGVREYRACLDAQRDLVARRIAGSCGDTLVFAEHPPVLTIGRQGGKANILVSPDVLRSRGIEVVEIERGGDITYHGPGQLVAYPIFLLPEDHRDVHRFLRCLEKAVADTCRDFGVQAMTISGLTGVWVGSNGRNASAWQGEKKICSMGLAFRKWVSFHGLALNVNGDLSPFSFINLCGLKGKQPTSLAKECGADIDLADVKKALALHLTDLWSSFINGN